MTRPRDTAEWTVCEYTGREIHSADGLCEVHGGTDCLIVVAWVDRPSHGDKTAELARAAFALQELRYHAWMALKAYDKVSFRKAQHAALDDLMEAIRSALPLGKPVDRPSPQEGRLIAAFPATGKSYYAEHHDNVADSDSSAFSWMEWFGDPGEPARVRHPDWPGNYLRHIKRELGEGKTVLVSTHAEVRRLLTDERLPFTLVYPQGDLREEYVDRMVKRGSPQSLINVIYDHFETWVTEMHEQPCAVRIVLGPDDYLSDVLDRPSPPLLTEEEK